MELMQECESNTQVVWPQAVQDCLQRQEGLILWSGTRHSRLGALELSLKNLSLNRVFSTDKHLGLRGSEAQSADVVVYRGMCEMGSTMDLLHLSEEGRMVIQIVMAPSVISSLHKVLSVLQSEKNSHQLWRYVDQLQLMVNQVHLIDTHQRDFFAHEVVLGTPGVKKLLLDAQVSTIESQLRENAENQGMVSLNQILLQLMIRRKIDLKTAFLKTRDPDNLDSLLKRVGI